MIIQVKNKHLGIVKVLIDENDYKKLEGKSIHIKTGNTIFYAIIKINGKNIRLHRFIMGLKYGDNREIDHINGDGLDNRRKNLRICTREDNMKNTRSRVNSSSKYLGVSWNSTLKYWVGEVRANKRRVWCSYFKSEIDAAKARDRVAKIHHGEFVRLNFNE